MMNRIFALAPYLTAVALFARAFSDDLVIPITHHVISLAAQGSGQFLVAQPNGITRFNEDGAIDTSFPFFGGDNLAVENDESVLAYKISTITRLNMDTVQESVAAAGVRTYILQPDGKLIVSKRNPSDSAQPSNLFRLNPDGAEDSSFTPSPAAKSALALQQDGKLLKVATNGVIARLNADGSPDLTFSSPVINPPLISAIVVQPDGRIIVGGEFLSAGPDTRYGLLRLNSDGTLDSAFNPGPFFAKIASLALQADGKILLSGFFSSIGGGPAPNIARLNPDGTLDSSFAFDSFPVAYSALSILLADGSVLAAFSTNLVRFANPDPAQQTLTREGSTLTWLRGGSSPELFHARFQASLDGITWTDLGAAERIDGGWRLNNASVPGNARLRGRGYVTGTSWHVDFVPGAPAIYSQPSDRTVNTGTNVTFHISANGIEPLAIQWFKEGQPLEGANSPALLLTDVSGEFTGAYFAVVSNSEGSSTSRVAHLTVIDLSQGIKLAMLSHKPQTRELTLTATAPGTPDVILQISADLQQWTSLQTNSLSGQLLQIMLTNQTTPHAFYRLLQTTNQSSQSN